MLLLCSEPLGRVSLRLVWTTMDRNPLHSVWNTVVGSYDHHVFPTVFHRFLWYRECVPLSHRR